MKTLEPTKQIAIIGISVIGLMTATFILAFLIDDYLATQETRQTDIVGKKGTKENSDNSNAGINPIDFESDIPAGVLGTFNADQSVDAVQIIYPEKIDVPQVYIYKPTKPETCHAVTFGHVLSAGLTARDTLVVAIRSIDPQLIKDAREIYDGNLLVTGMTPWIISQNCGDINFVGTASPADISKLIERINRKRPKATSAETKIDVPNAEQTPEGIIKTSFNADQSLDLIQIVNPEIMPLTDIYLYQASTPETCRLFSVANKLEGSPHSDRDLAQLMLGFEPKLTDKLNNISGYFPVSQIRPWLITTGCGEMHYVRMANQTEIKGLTQEILEILHQYTIS